MGISSKKQKTTQTSNTVSSGTSTTQNTLPDYASNAIQDYTGRVTDLMGQDPASLVAPTNDTQKGVFSAARSLLSGQPNPNLTAASSAAQGAVGQRYQLPAGLETGESLLSNLEDYYNPFEQRVIDTSLADHDVEAGKQRAAYAAQEALNRGFSGSRGALTEAALEGELIRARDTLGSGLRYQGFNTATDLSNKDADRRQQAKQFAAQLGLSAFEGGANRDVSAAGVLGQLGQAEGQENRQNLALAGDIGSMERGIAQEGLDAPLSQMSRISQLLQGAQFGLVGGSTTNQSGTVNSTGTSVTKSTPSLMDRVGQAIQIAAVAASDERLKKDVRPLGRDVRGLEWFGFRYLWDAATRPLRVGVMAQQVARIMPDAVVRLRSGFLAVDYSKLGEVRPWA